ncbi:hypothetical protein R2083_11720 [Nitrosomonas sp. Is35]|uniref:hypothetical protein n=1 Tax=Nitrosomonas sp. Is35 TaxID=3080534 RepID=UPI00294B8492|nr:hypothetical protein [Nitrosomonas sp. Is35]MDV6348183.1 hypothetical protein [Nitrosomonas sp. Is35]
MSTKKNISKFTLIVSASLFFAACSSTSEVRELAKITSINSSLVNTELSGFVENSRANSEERAANIAAFSKQAEKRQVTFETNLQGAHAAAVIAGETGAQNYATLINELRRTSNIIQERQRAALLRDLTLREQILSSQQVLMIPKNDLSTISKKLGILAEEPTYQEQLQFLTDFFSAVLKDIKEAQNTSNQATSSSN